MLVIDRSKENLLSMKEKELKIGNNKEVVLDEYKALAIEIDNEMYNALIDKIKNTDLHNLSLEEQLVVLSEIADDYKLIEDKQSRYKNAYCEGYKLIHGVDGELELNDLSNILIDDVGKRIRAVQGYLVNSKSIAENKKASEKLNLDLIEESKKKDNALDNFNELELELKNNFLTAEGRNYDTNGDLVYNSILDEYKNLDLDLNELLDNITLLNELLDGISADKRASDEELLTTEMCYERVPNDENKDIFESVKRDNAKVNYKLVLLYMANLVAHQYVEYTSIILKRKQILSLNDERRHCMDLLGIKVSIDPFDRIRLKEQIDIVMALGNNDDKIEAIKRNIANLDQLIEEKTKENTEYSLELANDILLFKEDFKQALELVNEFDDLLDMHFSSKVINVKDKSPNMNMRRVSEQTKGVLERVYAMLYEEDKTVKEEVNDEINPTLLIEPLVSEEDMPILFEDASKDDSKEVFPDIEEIKLEEPFINEKNDEIFPDIDEEKPQVLDMPVLSAANQMQENELVFPDIEPIQTDEKGTDMPAEMVFPDILEKKEDTVEFDDNVVPFESVSLYNDRAGDDVFETKKDDVFADDLKIDLTSNNQENVVTNNAPQNTAADMFWSVDEGGNSGLAQDNPDDIVSFENSNVKTLKKVA